MFRVAIDKNYVILMKKVLMKHAIDDNRPILLVEDDEVDRMTVKRAMRKLKIGNALHFAENGEDALMYLNSNLDNLPCIILLDINMPRMNGIEFLSIIKQKPVFRKIPVIILTTSEEAQDRANAFDLSAAGYIVKPVNFELFLEVMDSIRKYWSISKFPD